MSRRSATRRRAAQRAPQLAQAPVAAATGWSGSEQHYGLQLSAEGGYVRGASPVSGPIGKTSSKQLRRWSRTNPWIRSAINLRRTQVSRSPFDVVVDDDAPKVPEAVRKAALALFRDPNPKERSFRAFIEPIVEDILVLDQGAVEQELSVGYAAGMRGGVSPVVHLWGIDGATIRVDPEWDGSDDKAERYFQFAPDGTPGAHYKNDELILIISNPVTYYPLGLSALEVLADTIEADIRSAEYAARIVSNASPPGIIDLGKGIRADQVDAFRAYWDAEIAGRSQIAVTGGSENGVKWVSLAQSAKEMQFMEWQEYLARKICAVFGCQPQDIGITFDVNRSQGETGSEHTSDVGVVPLLSLIAEYLTGEVVHKFSPFLRFVFTDIGRESQSQAAAYYNAAMPGVGFIRPNNALRERGEEPLEEYGDEVWVTSPGGPMPMSLYLEKLTAPPPEPPPIVVAPGQAGNGAEEGGTPGDAPAGSDSAPGDKPPAAPAPATPPAEGATGKAVGSGRAPFSVLSFYRRPGGVPLSTVGSVTSSRGSSTS
jgi:Phage portal protein